MDALVTQTCATIEALGQPSHSREANEWLMKFEISQEAWSVAVSLASLPSNAANNATAFRYWGAKFLHTKVQRDYKQLMSNNDRTKVYQLTETLVKLILQCGQHYSASKSDATMVRLLCMALSALALQMNQAGIVTQILTWMNPIVSTSPGDLIYSCSLCVFRC